MRGNKLFKFLDYYGGVALLGLLSLFKRRNKGISLADISPRRILVIKFVALGDAVLLVPSLRALKMKFPDSEVLFLGTDLTETFLRKFPEFIDRCITVDVGKLVRNPMYFLRTRQLLRSLNCDIVVDFEQWSRLSALFAAVSGAGLRLGFRTKNQHRHAAFTHTIERDSTKHEVDNFLSLARLLTTEEGSRELEIKVDEASLVRMQGYVSKHGWRKGIPIVVAHPGCGTHGFPREWAPKNYASLLNQLANEGELFVVVTGTASESVAMSVLSQDLTRPALQYVIEAHDDFVALLSMASLVVSSNNGAMHLAAALRVPQVALHGPTNAAQWGPLNPKAMVIRSHCPGCPCLDLGFEYHRRDGYCMEQIDAGEVVQAAKLLLTKRNPLRNL